MSSINKSLGTEKDKPVLATIDKNGEPICPAGSVIDNNFSIFDNLNPSFTCEPILKPNFNDMLNKPESNTNNFVTNRIRETTPAAGGKRRKTKKIYVRKTKRRIFKRRKHTRRR